MGLFIVVLHALARDRSQYLILPNYLAVAAFSGCVGQLTPHIPYSWQDLLGPLDAVEVDALLDHLLWDVSLR